MYKASNMFWKPKFKISWYEGLYINIRLHDKDILAQK